MCGNWVRFGAAMLLETFMKRSCQLVLWHEETYPFRGFQFNSLPFSPLKGDKYLETK